MQRRGGTGHFLFSSRVATSAGSGGPGRSNSGGCPCEGGPWSSRHRPRATNRNEARLSGAAEESIDSGPETQVGTSGDAASRFEPRDVPPLLPLWLGLLIAAFIIGVFLWVTIGFPLADHQQYRGPLKPLAPAPRLETAPVAQRQSYDRAKKQELKSITAAMQATAQQGWGPPK